MSGDRFDAGRGDDPGVPAAQAREAHHGRVQAQRCGDHVGAGVAGSTEYTPPPVQSGPSQIWPPDDDATQPTSVRRPRHLAAIGIVAVASAYVAAYRLQSEGLGWTFLGKNAAAIIEALEARWQVAPR